MLGKGIRGLAQGLAPEAIVIGGEITAAWPLIEQKLKAAIKVMGAKTDLEICGLIAKEMGSDVVKTVGIWSPEKVFEEVRKTVHGYDVAMPVIATGGAAPTMPLNGRVASLPGTVASAGDTLFTSGTLSRYSKILNSVMEAPGQLYGGKGPDSDSTAGGS